MAQVLQANKITAQELETIFQLQEELDATFFPEWQTQLPELTEFERTSLDKIRAGYFNGLKHPPFLEKAVQIVVLSPLLFLADCFLPPFRLHVEKSVAIADEDEGVIVNGNLDILLLKDQLWVMAIESKRATYSIEAGLPQLIAYLLASPETEKPCYGMITTGGEFIFIKLVKGENPRYATSDQFVLRRKGNELFDVFRILKRLICNESPTESERYE